MPAPPLPFVPQEQHGRPVVLAMILHVGSSDASRQALAPFREIAPPIADLLRPMSYDEMYPPDEGEYRPLASARTMFVDTIDRGVAAEILGRLAASTAQMTVAQLRVLGGAMAGVPADATAFAHRSRRIMLNLAAVYATRDEAPVHEAWLARTAESLRQGDDHAYVNFLGDEGQDRVRAAYPGRTWGRLTAVKRRYDPENVFRLNQNIPPEGADFGEEAA
jgi:hypothetical protein